MEPSGLLYQLSIWAIPVLIAITFHEAAHGYVAWKLGDATAYERGRVTFNPFRHIDPFGTVVLPALLLMVAPFVFGWAKPVPINLRRLRNPARDMVWVALAGPGVNILLAGASAFLLQWFPFGGGEVGRWAFDVLQASMLINVILAVFNMLPLPPLDGGRVAVGVLPYPLARQLAKLERFGLPILIFLLLIVPIAGQYAGLDLDVFALLVIEPAKWMLDAILWLTAPL